MFKTASTNSKQSKSNDAAFLAKASSSSFIQPKLNVGKPGDKYEVEADHVADQVVAKSHESPSPFFPPTPATTVQKQAEEDIQKQEEETIQEKPLVEHITPVVQLSANEEIQEKCADCKKEEALQKKENGTLPSLPEEVIEENNTEAESPTLESEAAPEPVAAESDQNTTIKLPKPSKTNKKSEEESVQKKENSQSETTTNHIEQSLQSSKGGGSSLNNSVQNEMNTSFGADFSKVKIHTDSNAVQMNKDLGAHAFTHGNDIYFNEGKYNPSNDSGKHLLAHELTHTIQQNASSEAIQKYAPATEKKPPPQGNPAKPGDGIEVEGKSNNKINNDDRVQDQDELSEEERQEKENPPRGEVRQEQSNVRAEGISTPAVDRGAVAQEQISEQKEQMDAQLSEEAPAAEEEGESETPLESNMGEADAAAQRALQAEQAATSVQIPNEPQPFQHPNVSAPVDSAGAAIPRQAAIDTQVRGLGYIGEMLREKGYEMKMHASEKETHAYGLDAVLEKQREDLALAKEGTKKIDEQNLERKDISEKSKLALDESKDRQQFVSTEAPALAQEADGGKSDSAALASDANAKSNQSKNEIPDDPDARADAEQQSGEMEETAQGAQSMDDAVTQTGDRARQYIQDAEIASQDNQQSETSIQETDNNVALIDGRVAEMTAANEVSNIRIENAGPGPELIRQHAARTANSGDELISASIIMEQELNALQDEYLSSMAAIESKEDAEQRAQEEATQEQPDVTPEEQQLYTLADLSDEEQEQQVSQMSEPEKAGLLATLDRMIATAPDNGTDATEGARTKVDLGGVNNAIAGAQSTAIRAGLEGVGGELGTMAADAMGVGQNPSDPRTPQIQAVDNQRNTRLSGVLDIADQNMNHLSQEQQQILAERLVAESITDDIKNIDILQMGRGMLEGMVNPAMALQGVVGGFEKTFTGVANIFNAEAWERDPLGNLLQVAADISTGLAMIFSSILGIAGMITALMVALTIFSWGTLSPITAPVIGWMGTVMTYAGWGAIVSGLLSVYFNSLAYIKNLHDAGTASTARELFGNTEQMKQNATDGFQGAMAIVEGVGAVKMGPSLSNGDFMANVPRSPGAFARQTVNGAREGLSAVASLPGRAARGAQRLFGAGRQGLVAFKNKIVNFFRRPGGLDLDVDTPRTRQRNQDILDGNQTRSLDEMTPEQRRVDLQETANHPPRQIDPDSPHYRTHDVEIESNGHTYRRRRDGNGWCRFSAQECGIGEAELPDSVQEWLDRNDQMLRDNDVFGDTPENQNAARQDAERDIAEAEGTNQNNTTEDIPETTTATQPNPNHTTRQRNFEEGIQERLNNGDITPDQARQLREFNEANPSGSRDMDAVLRDIDNPNLELNPATGRYRDKNGSGGIEIDDATRQRTEAGRSREGANQTPEADTPEYQRLNEQKTDVNQNISDAEAEIDALSDPNNTSDKAVEYRQAREESLETRHPEGEHRNNFNQEYDDINGGNTADPDYINERNDAFLEDRERVRQQHAESYDRGRRNNVKGDAFEDTRLDQLNLELEQRLGRPLGEGEGYTRRTPADKIEFDVDGETVRVSPDLEHAGGYIESKSGRLSLTPEVENQIIRYAQLSQHAGKQITYELLNGASENVLAALRRYGIDYIDFSKIT